MGQLMSDGGKVWVFSLDGKQALSRWDRIAEVLAPAMQFEDGKYTLDDMRRSVEMGLSQAWVAAKGSVLYGAAITQVVDYPQKSMLLVVCLAGKCFELWDNIVKDHLVPYAKHYECSGIEFYGRKGWERRARALGFVPVHHVYELAIKEDCDAEFEHNESRPHQPINDR